MGTATAQIASAQPDTNFLGVEVHVPGVGALLKQIDEQGLRNIRIIEHDAVEVVQSMLGKASLDGIHIFFPDPWHKARHHKRRLFQPAFVQLLATRLKLGGYIHCATDWEHYAQQMLEVLCAEPLLRNTAPPCELYTPHVEEPNLDTQCVPRPAWRPVTKFEKRGLLRGHGIWDLVFQRHHPASF
jgi:tRNA (guanine-N7-)-methyltransferase